MDYVTKDTALTATADAIREKTGTADPITWLEELGFSEAIAGIESGGGSGGFDSNHLDIAYGSFIPAESVEKVLIDCGFSISADDSFAYFFGCVPIAERTESANFAGYFANKMPSAAIAADTPYGGTFYANSTATKFSSSTSVNIDNIFGNLSGTNIYLKGYGAWKFSTSLEYFWVVLKEKNA